MTIVLALVLGGLVYWAYKYDFGFPNGISEQSAITMHFWNGTWVAAFAVGILTWGLMIFAAVAYRRRRGDAIPRQLRYNIPIEVMYTVMPIAMVLAIVYFTVRDEAQLTKVSNDQQQTVQVTGFRWSWNSTTRTPTFTTPDFDARPAGHAHAVPAGQPEGAVQAGSPMSSTRSGSCNSSSRWMSLPGRINTFEVTPNQLGTFAGKCAEYCGTDHSRMLFNVKVVDQADFDAHMAELKAKGRRATRTQVGPRRRRRCRGTKEQS